MFFKVKCPNCGAKNSKERMTCAACGDSLVLGRVKNRTTEVPPEVIGDIESTTLCEGCQKENECLPKGVLERETCDQYEPLSVDELSESDELLHFVPGKVCPECGCKIIQDCKNNPLLEDDAIGQCLDCRTYWCLECGYIFKLVEKNMECPHWGICADCSEEHGYLSWIEFMETICPTCEYYDTDCQFEDSLQCDKQRQLICPHEADISQCPKVGAQTSNVDSSNMENEYVKYIPGKCIYCRSSNISETLKRTIKGEIADGYLWDICCANCRSEWVALEKPDYQ